MNTKERYFKEFNIEESAAKKNALLHSQNAVVTAATELLGEAIIKKYRLWNSTFPNYKSVKKATSKKNQKEGIDFFITTEDDAVYTVDLKVCCGPDYTAGQRCYKEPQRLIKSQEGFTLNAAPIELTQNGIRTFTSSKKTDYVFFIFADDNGISYSLITYDRILETVNDHIDKIIIEKNGLKQQVKFIKDRGPLVHFTSNNGSGVYVLLPVKSIILTKRA